MQRKKVRFRKKWLLIAAVIGVLLLGVSQLSRTRITMLYIFSGMKAPVAVRWACVKETEQKVTQKFQLPLDFDRRNKSLLREFWHYSYLRQCLYVAGYGMYGEAVPDSTVMAVSEGGFEYTNALAEFRLVGLQAAEVLSDNTIDVDYDDRLRMSTLLLNDQEVQLGVYLKYDDVSDIESLAAAQTYFPTTSGAVVSQHIVTDAKHPFVYREQDDGQKGLLLLLPNQKVLTVFSPNLSIDFATAVSQMIQ